MIEILEKLLVQRWIQVNELWILKFEIIEMHACAHDMCTVQVQHFIELGRSRTQQSNIEVRQQYL